MDHIRAICAEIQAGSYHLSAQQTEGANQLESNSTDRSPLRKRACTHLESSANNLGYQLLPKATRPDWPDC